MSFSVFARLNDKKAELKISSTLLIKDLKTQIIKEWSLPSVNDYQYSVVNFGQDTKSLADEDDSKTLPDFNFGNLTTIILFSKTAPRPRISKKKAIVESDIQKGDLSEEQVIELFSKAKDVKAFNRIKDQVCVIGKQVLDSKAFVKTPKPVLIELFKCDKLNAAEVEIFEAALRWAKIEAKSDSPDDIKKVLTQDILNQIRFPILSSTELATKVVPANILSLPETLELFGYVGGQGAKELGSATKQYSTKPRERGVKYIKFESSGPYMTAGTQSVEHLNDFTDRSLTKGICANSPGWIIIELQYPTDIQDIEIGGWNGNSSIWGCTNGAGARIETSNDKSSWVHVGTVPSDFGVTIQKLTLTKSKAKFVRFQHTSYLGLGYFKIFQK